MNATLLNNNYLLINDFISVDRAKDMYQTFKALYKTNPEDFKFGQLCPTTPALYNGAVFLELLLEKLPFLNSTVEETLFPTYCYGRIYKNGDSLRPHIDRKACEISITLHLGSDGVEWPIYFRKPDTSVVEVVLKPGQAVIYLGCVAEHWRAEYEGNEYGQVFLHYVRSRGPNGKYYFDKVRD